MLAQYIQRLWRWMTGAHRAILSPSKDKKIVEIIQQVHQMRGNINLACNILWFPSYYNINFTRIFDILLASSLMLRGAQIQPVITGPFYPKEDTIFGGIYNHPRKKLRKRYDLLERKIWKSLLRTNLVELCQYRVPQDIALAKSISQSMVFADYPKFMFEDYSAGHKAAIATINLNNIPDVLDDPVIAGQLREHLSNIVQLYRAYDRIFQKVKPQAVFANYPYYYQWHLAYHFSKKYKIPFYSAGISERKNTYFFSSDSEELLDSSPAWPTFAQQQLDDATQQRLQNAIQKRMYGQVAHFSPYPQPFQKTPAHADLEKKLRKDRPIVFFPVNVLYDAAVLQKSYVFANLIDMVKQVVLFMKEHPNCQLILKAHPAEKIFYRMKDTRYSQHCLKYILQDIPLSDNIIFLDYDTPISTYDLIPLATIGIVFSSSTAMEMSWFGKPVLAVAQSHYYGKGFTYEPKSIPEFFSMLTNLLQNQESPDLIQKRIELSQKYYLLYYYHSQVDFGLLQGSDTGVVEDQWKCQSYEELLPGHNPALDYVCKAMLEQLPIHGDHRWPPATF